MSWHHQNNNPIITTTHYYIIGKLVTCKFGWMFRVPKGLHIACNISACDLPYVYAFNPHGCDPSTLGTHMR